MTKLAWLYVPGEGKGGGYGPKYLNPALINEVIFENTPGTGIVGWGSKTPGLITLRHPDGSERESIPLNAEQAKIVLDQLVWWYENR